MGAAAGKSATSESHTSGDRSAMSCEACCVRFTPLKRKKNCCECSRNYCAHCAPKIKSGSARRCQRCQVLVSGNFDRADLQDYKAKEIRQFLVKRRVAVDNCREKTDLIDLLMQYSNNTQYRLEQQANEIRRQELQARARESLGSPAPQPPTYGELFNTSRDQNNDITLVEDHFSNTTAQINNTRNLKTEMPTGQSADQSNQSRDQPSPSRGQSREETICDESADQSNKSYQHLGTRDAEEPMDWQGSDIPPSQGEGHSTDDQGHIEVAENTAEDSSNREANESVENSSAADEAHNKDDGGDKATPVGRKKLLISDVESVQDIERLSTRQLKELLERHFVDYKGCVEKHELITRVTRLWNESQRNVQAAEEIHTGESTTGNSEMCKICMDAVVDCVLLDCGHMLTCTTCGKQLAECPICRQYIVRVVHVFKS